MARAEYSVKRFLKKYQPESLAASRNIIYDRGMNKQPIEGQEVTLRSAHGEIVRIIVRVMDDVVLVCRPEDDSRAKRDKREPSSVGFKVVDIVR